MYFFIVVAIVAFLSAIWWASDREAHFFHDNTEVGEYAPDDERIVQAMLEQFAGGAVMGAGVWLFLFAVIGLEEGKLLTSLLLLPALAGALGTLASLRFRYVAILRYKVTDDLREKEA